MSQRKVPTENFIEKAERPRRPGIRPSSLGPAAQFHRFGVVEARPWMFTGHRLRCRLTQMVSMYGQGPENYGTAVDGDGSPSPAPTGNSTTQIWSPAGVNCPVRMRAIG